MFKRSIFAIAIFTAAFVGFVSTANAQGGTFLGSRNVTDRADHDVIAVGASLGTFDRLQFRVSGHAVDFKRVVVHYVNGGDEEMDLRDRIPAGGETRWIDLRGTNRNIRASSSGTMPRRGDAAFAHV